MLLLPEKNADMILKKTDYNAYDDVLDPRPICIQTKNNFSHFLPHNYLEEDHIISRLKYKFLFHSSTLAKDKIVVTSQRDFLPKQTPVWAKKHTKPVPIIASPKRIFIPQK